ncbi:site-specific integrase [Haloarchaeobius sp. TZWWS8]|uniref:site-specific integrase n=1 Tax=Haloarchaeobius sp. TZWWS8 TaxID=3446121 RepID=UPI003EBFB46B
MRTERNRDGTWNVWMSREEYRELPRQATTFEREIAIRLMGDCGLRVAEVLDVCPEHISRMSDGRHYQLEVVAGKDTSGEYNGGKHREAWLPIEVEALINRYVQNEDVDDDKPLIDRSKRTVQYWVEDAADVAAAVTGDADYERVSSHDLRRCWANHLLVEENVSPRIVMALGGWRSYDAIEPYLTAPSEEKVARMLLFANI